MGPVSAGVAGAAAPFVTVEESAASCVLAPPVTVEARPCLDFSCESLHSPRAVARSALLQEERLLYRLQEKTGKIKSTDPTEDPGGKDNSLPDPTNKATLWLAILVLLAGLLAIGLNEFEWTNQPFTPSATATATFALFAGFYVAAQVIERLMQLISPFVPWWPPPTSATSAAVRAAQTKADRGTVALGIAAVLGVGASAAGGLYFLTAIGMHVNRLVDIFITGIVIAAGTKPLHDFITLLQKPTSPETGSDSS